LYHQSYHLFVSNSLKTKQDLKKKESFCLFITDIVVSIFVSLPILVAVKGFGRVKVFGIDCDVVGGDID